MPNGNSYHRFAYLPHWHYPVRLPGLTGLYLNTTIRVFAIGLVGIFIPLFIWQLTHSWEKVILFFLAWKTIQILLAFPLGYLITRLGPDLAIALAGLFHIFFLTTLIFSLTNPSLVFWSPLLAAVAVPLHWIPYHTAFSQESSQKNLNQQVSLINILQRVAAALAPLIGGIIATELGFSFLYLVAITLLLVSIFPVFMDQYQKKDSWPGIGKIVKETLSPSFRFFFLSFLGTGIETAVYTVFWPLFLLEKLGNMEKIGLLTTLSFLLSLLFLHWVGHRPLKENKKLLQTGGLVSSLIWGAKSFFSSLSLLTLMDLLYQLATILVWIPTGAIVYHYGRKKTLSFFLRREIIIQTGFLIGLIFSWLLFLSPLRWWGVFLLGAGGIFMASLIRESDG